jgi:MFS transporter, DHA2 family, multidrug resistance protein
MEGQTIHGSKLAISVAAMFAALIAVLDISIVNVAINDIRASFGTPIDQIAWVSTGYMMANIVVIPMTGWLQRKFGYRRYFVASILLFTLASALCGLAWNLPSLVAFRALQGLGGGAIIPTSQAILYARYPPSQHGVANAIFGIGAMTGPLVGPALGGVLIDSLSWHWIFLINVPFGLLVALIAWQNIHQPGHEDRKEPIDRSGIVLLAVGMATLQYVLEEGHRDGWFESRRIVLLSAVAAIALVTFVVHELEAENPVVDLRVFKNSSYCAATLLNFLTGIALFSSMFLFALYCGAVMGYAALDIGMLFLKGTAIQLLLIPLIGRFGTKIDPRVLILFGMSMMCLSLWSNAHLTELADQRTLIRPIFIRALGLGAIFIPLNLVALADLPERQRGNAGGLFNLTRELGGSVGTAWMSTRLDANVKQHLTRIGEHVSPLNSNTLEQLGVAQGLLGARSANPLEASLMLLQGRMLLQALVRAFEQGFLVLTIVFCLSMVLVLFLKRPLATAVPAGAH